MPLSAAWGGRMGAGWRMIGTVTAFNKPTSKQACYYSDGYVLRITINIYLFVSQVAVCMPFVPLMLEAAKIQVGNEITLSSGSYDCY